MKNTKLLTSLFGLINSIGLGVFLFTAYIPFSYANEGKLLAKFPAKVNFFSKNNISGLIYASTDSQILIINPQMKTVNTIPSWGDLAGLTFSEDQSKLYVSKSSAQEIMVIDTITNEILEPIELPYMPYDLRLGSDGYLYATLERYNDYGFMQIDPQERQFVKLHADFSNAETYVPGKSLMEVSPDHKTLYFGDQGNSPSSLSVFTVSESEENIDPQFIYKNKHGALGSNGQDLHLSANGEYLYYVVGSGNSLYDIARIRTSDMAIKGRLHVGAYPTAITTTADGKTAYAMRDSSMVQVWDTTRQVKLCEFAVGDGRDEINKMTLDNSGEILLVAFASSLNLYQAGCPN